MDVATSDSSLQVQRVQRVLTGVGLGAGNNKQASDALDTYIVLLCGIHIIALHVPSCACGNTSYWIWMVVLWWWMRCDDVCIPDHDRNVDLKASGGIHDTWMRDMRRRWCAPGVVVKLLSLSSWGDSLIMKDKKKWWIALIASRCRHESRDKDDICETN